MNWIEPALYGLSAVATVLAWTVARSRVEHRPIAYLLTVGLASDVARRALRLLVLRPPGVPPHQGPYTGAARIAWFGEVALFLSWPATLAAVALAVYLGKRAWAVALAYVALALGIIVAYPVTRGALLARIYTGAQVASVMVAIGCAVTWYRESKTKATTAQAALSFIVSVEMATLVLSWRAGIFDNWHLSQVAYLILFAVLILLQGGTVWFRSPS